MKRAKIPWLSRVSYLYQHTISGVATFTGMGGSFQTEWVATFHRNRWQPWTGILTLLDVWAEIMEQTPKSRLLMQCAAFAEAETVTAIKSRMENSGIDAARLRLLGPQSFMQAMARYDEIDIALDPFPYNGGTTTCHALWMGTPVITLAGKYFCGRMGVSILAATKRADWIASDPTEYIEKAVTLASTPENLYGAQKKLAEEIDDAPICDIERYSRALAQCYRGICDY